MLIDRALASEIRTGSGSLTRAFGQSCGFATQKTAFMSSHLCSSRTHIARMPVHPFQRTVQQPKDDCGNGYGFFPGELITGSKIITVTVTEIIHRRDGSGTVGLFLGIHVHRTYFLERATAHFFS